MLSGSESRVLNFVIKSIHEEETSPTFQEIGDACYLSAAGARLIVLQLEAKGFLRRRENKFRSIRVARLPTEEAAA